MFGAADIQVFSLALINSLLVPNEVVGRQGGPSEFLFVISMVGIFIGHLLVFQTVCTAFNVADRSRWFSRLPFSKLSKDLFPVIFLTVTGLLVLHFSPIGFLKSGATLFFVGLSVGMFLISKYSRSEVITSLKSGFYVFPMAAFGFFSVGWFYMRPQVVGELWLIPIYFLSWLIFEKPKKLYLLVPICIILLYFTVSFIKIQMETPESYGQAVANYSFYPTKKTLSEVKRIALDGTYWESAEQYFLPKYVNYWSKIAAQRFSDKETINFVENIAFNFKLWRGEKLPKLRRQNWGVYLLEGESCWLHCSRFPLEYRAINKNVEDYLYKNWKSSEVFCDFLPVRATERYLHKLFRDSECRNFLRLPRVWQMYFSEDKVYKNKFSQYLLDAYEKSPPLTRSELMRSLMNGWSLDFKKFIKQHSIIFNQRDVDETELRKFISEAYLLERGELFRIAKNPVQASVYSEIKKFPTGRLNNEAFPVHYACAILMDGCMESALMEYRRRRPLVEHIYAWLVRLRLIKDVSRFIGNVIS